MKIIDYNKYECIKTEQTKPENEKADKYSKPSMQNCESENKIEIENQINRLMFFVLYCLFTEACNK